MLLTVALRDLELELGPCTLVLSEQMKSIQTIYMYENL